MAVSGAAGSASIVAAKHGLRVQAAGGVGYDDMGHWVLIKLGSFGTDTQLMERCAGFTTSSSLITTRPPMAPALPYTSAALRMGLPLTTPRSTDCLLPASCISAAWAR